MPFSIRLFPPFISRRSVLFNAGVFLDLPLAFALGLGILTTLLVLSGGLAYADGVAMGTVAAEGGATIYMDRDTIRRNGNLVNMWQLTDFKAVQTMAGPSFMSRKTQWQFDCSEESLRQAAILNYSDHMGEGIVVFSHVTKGSGYQLHQGVLLKLCG